ncbi:MAG: alpha/beta hydrolase [Segetibacter sp.]
MEKKFQYLDTEIFYKVTGNGQPVVLLHGFAEDSNIWNEQVNFLQEHCLLIILDLTGSGKSEMLQKNKVTIEDYAASVNAVLINENIDKCILLGHSMGGYIALAFAEIYAEKLQAFGLVHSSAFADNEEKISSRKKGIKMMEEYGVLPFLKNTTPNLFSENYKKQHPERVSDLIEQGKNFSKDALIQYYEAMMNRSDRTEVLRKSNMPVLFIIGFEDKAAPLADLLHQVHLPKVSYIHIVEGCGHMSMWEKTDELNNYLLEFIKHVS